MEYIQNSHIEWKDQFKLLIFKEWRRVITIIKVNKKLKFIKDLHLKALQDTFNSKVTQTNTKLMIQKLTAVSTHSKKLIFSYFSLWRSLTPSITLPLSNITNTYTSKNASRFKKSHQNTHICSLKTSLAHKTFILYHQNSMKFLSEAFWKFKCNLNNQNSFKLVKLNWELFGTQKILQKQKVIFFP